MSTLIFAELVIVRQHIPKPILIIHEATTKLITSSFFIKFGELLPWIFEVE